MCIINPFCALRPSPGKVNEIASHSVERYSKEEIKQILAHNPISFLQVIHPIDIAGQDTQDRLHSIKNKLNEFISKNIFWFP